MQIVVLGPHRSGTSLVTRLISLMDVFVGDTDGLLEPAIDNPKGFWERRDVVLANDAVLAHFGCAWDQLADWTFDDPPRSIPCELTALVTRAVAGLGQHPQWVVKDPRFCQTLPYWRPHLARPIAVLVSRDPAEVALSIVRRNHTSFGHALAIWEYCAVGALVQARELPAVHVTYQALLDDPVGAVARLHADLVGLGGSGLTRPAAEAVTALVDDTLWRSRLEPGAARALLTPHHRDLEAALAGRLEVSAAMRAPSPAAVTAMQQYRELIRQREHSLKIERRAADVEAAAQAVRGAQVKLAAVSESLRVEREAWERERLSLVESIAAVQADRDGLAYQLVALRRSWSWRLTSPFRLVGYVLTGNATKVRFILGTVRRRIYNALPIAMRRPLDRAAARAAQYLRRASAFD